MKAQILAAVFCLLSAGSCFAVEVLGRGSSGGGGAFVCHDRTSPEMIVDAELVDIWEAHALDSREINYSDVDYWTQVSKAIEDIRPVDPNLHARMVDAFNFIQAHIVYVRAGVTLQPPNDVDNGYAKEGCPLEGMMYFDGERNQLAIKREIFDKLLTETDKAAAIFHEVFYKVLRDQIRAPMNSVAVRKFTGCFFSKDRSDCFDKRTALERVPANSNAYVCSGNSWHAPDDTSTFTRFYYWHGVENGETEYNVLFDYLGGQSVPAGYLAKCDSPFFGNEECMNLVHQGVRVSDPTNLATKLQLTGRALFNGRPVQGVNYISTPFEEVERYGVSLDCKEVER